METTQIQCENVEAIRDDRVYCWLLQDWTPISKCVCNSERRKRASQEW
jgi:hypothetical protein